MYTKKPLFTTEITTTCVRAYVFACVCVRQKDINESNAFAIENKKRIK